MWTEFGLDTSCFLFSSLTGQSTSVIMLSGHQPRGRKRTELLTGARTTLERKELSSFKRLALV